MTQKPMKKNITNNKKINTRNPTNPKEQTTSTWAQTWQQYVDNSIQRQVSKMTINKQQQGKEQHETRQQDN